MIHAIDAVCNLWTKEINETRPQLLHDQVKYFWESYAKVSSEDYQGGTVADILSMMDRAGIQKAFLIAADLGMWRITYEKIHETVAEYPDRFYALAGINPEEGMKGVRRLEKAVKEMGFKGAHVYPHWFKTPPNDRIYYPFYAKCGWPWVEQALAVALKHPNVYLGSDAHAPKYWDPKFVHFLKTRGKNKVIFGTDFPIIGFERAMTEIQQHGFSEEIQQKFLRENVIRIFQLDEP